MPHAGGVDHQGIECRAITTDRGAEADVKQMTHTKQSVNGMRTVRRYRPRTKHAKLRNVDARRKESVSGRVRQEKEERRRAQEAEDKRKQEAEEKSKAREAGERKQQDEKERDRRRIEKEVRRRHDEKEQDRPRRRDRERERSPERRKDKERRKPDADTRKLAKQEDPYAKARAAEVAKRELAYQANSPEKPVRHTRERLLERVNRPIKEEKLDEEKATKDKKVSRPRPTRTACGELERYDPRKKFGR
jgi:hypothetical protein